MYLVNAMFLDSGSQICLERSVDNNFISLGLTSHFNIKKDALTIYFNGKKIINFVF